MSKHDQPSTALARVETGALDRRRSTPWLNLRGRAREALERISDQVRNRLELPDRGEMDALLTRLDRVDEQLARIAARRATRTTRTKSSVPAEP